ncbi:MAG: alpha-amylase family protein [Verrucomicrobiota bacterium]|jgi:hypothetical protein
MMTTRSLPMAVPHLGLLAGFAIVLACPLGAGAAAPENKPWFRRALVGMEIDPTGAEFGIGPGDTGYAAKYDGREVARRCKEAGGEYLVIWARDGEYAYYDSRFERKAPGLGSRDVLREAVEEGHKLGLAVIAYCVQQYCSETLRQHPEWRMVASDGKAIERVCFRSGYLDYMKQLLAEQLAYGIDGLVLDMMDQGFIPPYGCWCATCEQEFQAQCGRAMPRHMSWDEDWDRVLELRYASSDHFEKELTQHVHRLNPRATVYFNYHGNPPFSWEAGQRPVQHAVNGDFVTGETGLWNFGALTVGLNAEFYRAATPGRPFQAAMQRGVRGYFDQTTRPLNDLRWELLTLLAHGAFVTLIDKTAFDGWLDPVAYDRFGSLFKEALSKRAHFGHQPVREVGLYFSSRTRDWWGRDHPADYFMAFQGAHKAMVYEHIPWGVIHEENLALETLRQFPVVLLANAAILSDGEVLLFRRYVEGGGKLIVTGVSGTLDRFGGKQAESSLAELIGARLEGRLESQDNWLRFPAVAQDSLRGLQGDIRADWPLLVKGPAVLYQPATAVALGDLLKPRRTLHQQQGKEDPDFLMSAGERVGPAILVNQLGQGTVLTFAGSPDFATASELHIVETRRLLRYAVRFLDPRPRIEIAAPATVEAVVTDDPAGRTLRVHLLGYNSPPQTTPATDRPYVLPGLIEDAPRYRAGITLNRSIRRATVLNRSTVLQRRGNRLDLAVEDIHEVVVVRY